MVCVSELFIAFHRIVSMVNLRVVWSCFLRFLGLFVEGLTDFFVGPSGRWIHSLGIRVLYIRKS